MEQCSRLVYIKRVDLRGFKTFGRKVSLSLDRGLTVIAGPNGSGKSNILDSVKFALGELSPKELRGGTISDLIHKGGVGEHSPKSAYVAVQFDNRDRRIPVDAENVTISREFRRGGEGIYRMNGRRISRKQLTDILLSADIQVAGHNIVPQHAITRLAEVTPEERRTIIEDMIGIAVYDTKKQEAQLQLQQADVNLKVASARIDEVRQRVEALEKERNDYLRFVRLKDEVSQLQAKIISHSVSQIQSRIDQRQAEIQAKQNALADLKKKRDQLREQRERVQAERQKFEESVVEKGSDEIFQVERRIGDVSAHIASLRTQISSSESQIKSLDKQIAELVSRYDEQTKQVEAYRSELRSLKSKRSHLVETLEQKGAEVNASLERLNELRSKLGAHSREAEILEQRIHVLTQKIIRIISQIKASSTKIDLIQNHIRTLESRRTEYQTLIDSIKSRASDLSILRSEEARRLEDTQARRGEYTKLVQEREQELAHADVVSEKARVTLVEVETQRNIADNIAAEDKALELIEEMSQSGAVKGVHGRLNELIRIDEQYRHAVEAAAAGWLKALVVDKLETALVCVESLKRTKLGRVKVIPLENVTHSRTIAHPSACEGLLGAVSDFIKVPDEFKRAVNYVFGDTVLTSSHRSAFLLSMKGTRAVAASGDLYEPGGGMEIGYYREPFDLGSLAPRPLDIKNLGATVSSLENIIERSKSDLQQLRKEILTLAENRTTSQNLLEAMDKELASMTANLNRYEKILSETETRIQRLLSQKQTEEVSLAAAESARSEVQSKLSGFEKERASLRLKTRSAQLLEAEAAHAALTEDLAEKQQLKVELDSRITAIESSLNTILPTFAPGRIQQRGLEHQRQKTIESLAASKAALEEAEAKLKQMEATRRSLSDSLAGVRAKRSEFEAELRKLESVMLKLTDGLDPVNSEIADLTAKSKEQEMRIGYHLSELKSLGYEKSLEVTPEQFESAQNALQILKKELDHIGAVNQLAVSQYDEVKENYKHLAGRIYELENEKLAILQFMNELDEKKFNEFIRAFNQVASTFQEIFSKLTSGGTGRLFLENPEQPFTGGADIFLRFPGKTEMTIGSASGGEKSVGTVCFLLALHAIHPMPFYIMDEIDAHLDVLNSQRLADLLRDRSKGSQFIVVSLKDVTISRADQVYGVFIQDGVSQIVSLPLSEAKARGRA